MNEINKSEFIYYGAHKFVKFSTNKIMFDCPIDRTIKVVDIETGLISNLINDIACDLIKSYK